MEPSADEPLWLACLCAGWCRTCDAYEPVLRAVAAEFEARFPGLTTRWIDIEDESDLVGEAEVETFPTLAVVDAAGLRFFGPLTPQPETLRRLLRATLDEWRPGAAPAEAEVLAFARRLREG
ncbi:MAG: thioredoxin family protein [Burkholderiales bacterium]|nr:thioredoxin family protein [Burkholderiales bacterium]